MSGVHSCIFIYLFLVGNCSVVRDHIINPPDDEYTLRLQPKCQTINVFCHNMQGNGPHNSAIEYITLNAGPENNMGIYHKSRLVNYNTCSGPEITDPSQTANFWGQTW